MVINASGSFSSPLRVTPMAPRAPAEARRLVEHCITEMRNVTESAAGSAYGMDAKCAVVVDFDNVQRESSRYVSVPPALQPGDPLHYDAFLQRICSDYSDRFGR